MTREEVEQFTQLRLDGFGNVCVTTTPSKGRVHLSVRPAPGRSRAHVEQLVRRAISELPIGPRYTYLVV